MDGFTLAFKIACSCMIYEIESFIYIEAWQFMVGNVFKCILEKKKKHVLPDLTKVFSLEFNWPHVSEGLDIGRPPI